jgi:hypothetical protein
MSSKRTHGRQQRTDRPVLPERPPFGRLVSGTYGRTGVDGHAVSAWICGPDGCPAADRTPATGVDKAWVRGSHRDMATGAACAQPDPVRNRCYRRPRPPQVSMVGVRPSWPPEPPVPEQERSCRGHCRTLPLWPSAMPSRFRTPRTDCRVRCPPGGCGATGTGRRVGGHWSDAANAGGHEQAGRSGGRGAGRGHRSSPAG